MAEETELVGGASTVQTIDYQQPDDEVNSETLIPQIILVLRSCE